MTTGERLVEISTLTTGTALEHFLNIATVSTGDVLIRVFDEYKIAYVPTEKGVIRYAKPPRIDVQYIKARTFSINYIPTEEGVIRYIKKPTIKIEYNDTNN